jgi:hypothetical protein
MDPQQGAQALTQEDIHLPDSAQPDTDACALQDVDLTLPGFDLLPGWSSDLAPSDVQSPVLAQSLDAWLQVDDPGELAAQAQALLQDYQQAVPQTYPEDQMDQVNAFSHRALHLCLLDVGLEEQ